MFSIKKEKKAQQWVNKKEEEGLNNVDGNLTGPLKLEGKDKIRNLLIIGRTGGGKSALANVLSDSDEFEESARSVSKTRTFQKKEFEWNGVKYRVVETDKIGEGINFMPEGISRILFVVDGVFTKEIATFIFENDIVEYTTIVRTKFGDFKNKDECEKDKQLLEKSGSIAEIVKFCSIIYVDNPPTNIIFSDEDDVEQVKNNRKRRTRSKTILLNHLETVCQGKYYN
ncbi:hypothetical protein C1645_825502 [Glomus cerebriforme]|uniref:AIG1-type G domain-containing protein n=1 Tax=Glomus cerebriforme TaxID=658196 RepID=A0A397SWH4_9GLOM|nr:hypothetical protein C1645_825502 [Glomus cerebriforme]